MEHHRQHVATLFKKQQEGKLAADLKLGDADEQTLEAEVNLEAIMKWFQTDHSVLRRCTRFGISKPEFFNWSKIFAEAVENKKIERLLPQNLVARLERGGIKELHDYVVNQFFAYLDEHTPHLIKNIRYLREITDLRYPQEWGAAAKNMQRRIIMHVGPTNSGKTYHALERLKNAERGVYCSPLRLLAYEVYNRMIKAGVSCALLTGEERIIPDIGEMGLRHSGYTLDNKAVMSLYSCTIEMVPTIPVGVAVIDEIQMIADRQRGWAWTNALLNVRANEIHLCGEPSAVPLVKRICASLDEEVEVREYKRLSELDVKSKSLGSSWKNIRPGDCVVVFSRVGIFETRKTIEKETGMKCAVIYGGLPPEARIEQARLFNDPDSGYDVLVASDAVGMGINLSIKRVVFTTLTKFDGTADKPISISQIRQIGGRAGRFNLGSEIGEVTALHSESMELLGKSMHQMPPSLPAAGIKPAAETIEMFSHQFPDVPFSKLWSMFRDISTVGDGYFLSSFSDQENIAQSIEHLPLTVRDRYQFLYAPVNCREKIANYVLGVFARCVALKRECDVKAAIKLPRFDPRTKDELRLFEQWHRAITLYLWLSFHYRELFKQNDEALALKELCEKRIQMGLENIRAQQAAEESRQSSSATKTEALTNVTTTTMTTS